MDTRKALEGLRYLTSQKGSAQLSAAVEGLESLAQLDRQASDTTKMVEANTRKLEQLEAKLLKRKQEHDDLEEGLTGLRDRVATESKELRDQAAAVQAEATERMNRAQLAATKAETASNAALDELKSIESQIEERKAALARLIA